MKYFIVIFSAMSQVDEFSSAMLKGNFAEALIDKPFFNRKELTDSIIKENDYLKLKNVVIENILSITEEEYKEWTRSS